LTFAMRIDAHLHFWKPACGFDNRPIADNAAYRRDFMPDDVLPDLDACGIDGAILVQTAPQTAETDWLIDLASTERRVWGVTAWVDLAGGSCDYAALLERPIVVGIRAQLRRIADDAFVTRPTVVANLRAALRAGLNVTILAEARHYRNVGEALSRLPPGPVTINHLALPFPAVDRTLVEIFSFRLKGAPEATFQRTLKYTNVVNSPSSNVMADDLEAYNRVQEGLGSDGGDWVSLHRAAGRDQPLPGGRAPSSS